MRPAFSTSPIATAALLTLLQAGAWAQTSTEPAEAGKLQTITVSAERRLENLQNVPSSISTLGSELLDTLNTSGQDIRMLAGRVPSLNIESSYGRTFPRFYLRGYGNTDFRLNASQPVSLVYDDIVLENPILKGFPAFDLDRIEVLRGPQGTLFGRNTPAGVVKLESARPSLKKTEDYASISYGTHNAVNVEGALNAVVSSDSALRLSVLNETRSDWIHNTYAKGPTADMEGMRDTAVRLQWLYEPSKQFSALANAHLRDFSGTAREFRANIIQPGTNDLVPGFDVNKVSFDGINVSTLKNHGANLRLRWNLGDMALHAITGYESVKSFSRGDVDGAAPPYVFGGGAGSTPFFSETADGMPNHSQWTQELRLESTGAGPLSWQAGVFLFKEDYKIESFDYDSTAGNKQDGYERIHQKNDAQAVFAALNYAVSPQLKLRGGLRYTWDKKNFQVEDYNNSAFVPCVLSSKCDLAGLGKFGPLSARTADKKLSWDLSATYALNRDTNLYARAATGFRASSVQGASAFNDQSVAGPENNTSVEAGIKADLLDRRARLNVGVFSYTVKDLQLTAVGGASGNSNVLVSAKKATGQGVEMDLQAYLSDRLLATLGVGYNDTQIKDPNLVVSVCGNGQYVTKLNCKVLNPQPSASTANINGNPLPQAPKTTLNFTLKYSQPMANGEVYALTDWVYRSKINFFLYQATEFTGKALTEGGLRVGYTWRDGKYDLAAFGRNITNQIRVVGGIDFVNLTGFLNEPRTLGVQFKAAF